MKQHEIDSAAAKEAKKFDYDPIYFKRSHSHRYKHDPTDSKTQVWDVVFEPDPEDTNKTTSNIATCGGCTICIIDVNSGKVLMTYRHKEEKEEFYTLAWTTLDLKTEGSAETKKTNILASGGSSGKVMLFHPESKLRFHEWSPVTEKIQGRKNKLNILVSPVHSLVFHPSNPTWLFCGNKDSVSLWDVGTLTDFDNVCQTQLLNLNLIPGYGKLYKIAWSGNEMSWLLAGTEAGMVGWHIDAKKIEEQNTRERERESSKYRPSIVNFTLPESEKNRDEDGKTTVDSLAVVSETTIVSKCVEHGLIYMWDLKATTRNIPKTQNEITKQDITILATLQWSDTDNDEMYLGCHKGNGLVVCGDDKGSLWLYNMPQMCKSNAMPIKEVVKPTTIIRWPELPDDPRNFHNIIIDKVTVSHDNRHIVAVTSNNFVCIWKKAEAYEDI